MEHKNRTRNDEKANTLLLSSISPLTLKQIMVSAINARMCNQLINKSIILINISFIYGSFFCSLIRTPDIIWSIFLSTPSLHSMIHCLIPPIIHQSIIHQSIIQPSFHHALHRIFHPFIIKCKASNCHTIINSFME